MIELVALRESVALADGDSVTLAVKDCVELAEASVVGLAVKEPVALANILSVALTASADPDQRVSALIEELKVSADTEVTAISEEELELVGTADDREVFDAETLDTEPKEVEIGREEPVLLVVEGEGAALDEDAKMASMDRVDDITDRVEETSEWAEERSDPADQRVEMAVVDGTGLSKEDVAERTVEVILSTTKEVLESTSDEVETAEEEPAPTSTEDGAPTSDVETLSDVDGTGTKTACPVG